eukprot:TRINITY_DN7677_c0_g1_i1.p1 TRINITY_DN7677_c0_g1~~TRINITY_DN7677_c0_g1_i1.p1  ORF type:complete len:1417 (+),score=342.43 TRINITY_DN7677_c0_g1_i1:271-4251(+)
MKQVGIKKWIKNFSNIHQMLFDSTLSDICDNQGIDNVIQDEKVKYQWLPSVHEDRSWASIASAFYDTSKIYGEIIIKEKSLSEQLKSIKTLAIGGKAGGAKYLVRGIFFKFAQDTMISKPGYPQSWLYGRDSPSNVLSIKGMNNEIKCLNALWKITSSHPLNDLNLPIMCLVDYLGYRLCAMSYLPLKDANMVYGTNDAGYTLLDGGRDRRLKEIGSTIQRELFLANHKVKEYSTEVLKNMMLVSDLEIHKKGKEYFILDFARLLPPSNKNNPFVDSFLPETMKMLKNHPKLRRYGGLSADAFTGFGSVEPHLDEPVEIGISILEEEIIPKFVEQLLDQTIIITKLSQVKELLHENGINIRYLGLVLYLFLEGDAAQLFDNSVDSIIFIFMEMVFRCMKHIIQKVTRKMHKHTFEFEEMLDSAIYNICSDYLFQHTEKNKWWWTINENPTNNHLMNSLLTVMDYKFPCPDTNKYIFHKIEEIYYDSNEDSEEEKLFWHIFFPSKTEHNVLKCIYSFTGISLSENYHIQSSVPIIKKLDVVKENSFLRKLERSIIDADSNQIDALLSESKFKGNLEHIVQKLVLLDQFAVIWAFHKRVLDFFSIEYMFELLLQVVNLSDIFEVHEIHKGFSLVVETVSEHFGIVADAKCLDFELINSILEGDRLKLLDNEYNASTLKDEFIFLGNMWTEKYPYMIVHYLPSDCFVDFSGHYNPNFEEFINEMNYVFHVKEVYFNTIKYNENVIFDVKNLVLFDKLEKLEMNHSETSDLKSLENKGSLHYLKLDNCKYLSDITSLEYCPNIREIIIHDCPLIVNINAMYPLAKITHLEFSNCGNLSNINALESMVKIQCIKLDHLPIIDIDSFMNLHALQYLHLEKCNMTNLRALSGCINLERLSIIECNDLVDDSNLVENYDDHVLYPLSGLENLRYLEINDCRAIKFVDTLGDLKDLEELSLKNCKLIEDINAIGNITELTTLDLNGCSMIISYEPLINLEYLTSLNLYASRISNTSSIQQLKKLEVLNIGNCKGIADIEFLRKFYKLQTLILTWSNITALDALEELNLYHIDISHSESVKDLSPIGKNLNLRTIVATNCAVHKISSFGLLTNLEQLDLSGCVFLKHLELSDDMEKLETIVLEGCTALKNLNLPINVQNLNIGSCTSLSHVDSILSHPNYNNWLPQSVIESIDKRGSKKDRVVIRRITGSREYDSEYNEIDPNSETEDTVRNTLTGSGRKKHKREKSGNSDTLEIPIIKKKKKKKLSKKKSVDETKGEPVPEEVPTVVGEQDSELGNSMQENEISRTESGKKLQRKQGGILQVLVDVPDEQEDAIP